MDILEIIIRTVITYLSLFIVTRTLGRREMSQLSFFDFICNIALGSVSATTMMHLSTPIYIGLAVMSTWGILSYGTLWLNRVSLPARKMLEGEPIIVIHAGRILENNVTEASYNIHELMSALRSQGVYDPSEVELGIIEPTGSLTVLKKPKYQPVTAKDIKLTTKAVTSQYIGQELIAEGKILTDNLQKANMTEVQLRSELQKQGVADPSNVTLAAFRPDGTLYIDEKKDSSNKNENNSPD